MSARELAGRAAGLAEQRRAFYDVLHDDPKFVRDLRTLFKSLFPAFSKSLTPQQRLDAIRLSDAREATPKHNAKVKAFVQRWSLPQAYAFEVWCALYTAQDGGPAGGPGSHRRVIRDLGDSSECRAFHLSSRPRSASRSQARVQRPP